MIGVRRQVNPALAPGGRWRGPRRSAAASKRFCGDHPDNRFLVSVLSRENQHELCVYARKFANLMPFGCWWFLNNPSIVEEITRERIEMLGMSFIPQHSDARVLEQLIYKWKQHTPHPRADPCQQLSAPSRRRARPYARRNPSRYHAAFPFELRTMDELVLFLQNSCADCGAAFQAALRGHAPWTQH